jgi:hypothetical protein
MSPSNSIKVFMEYKILPEFRDSFMALIHSLEQHVQELGGHHYEVYEGSDQPNLIVEEFYVDHMDCYHAFKLQRLDPQSALYTQLDKLVSGGGSKQHIWAFEKLRQ